MKFSNLPRRKAFLTIEIALALAFSGSAFGDDSGNAVTDSNVSSHTHTNHSLNNAITHDGGSAVNALSGVFGDINGSDNTVTLSATNATLIVGELRDVADDPDNEWAEGNTVTLSGGTFQEVIGGLGTGKAGARNNRVVITGGQLPGTAGTDGIYNGDVIFGGGVTQNGNAHNNHIEISSGTFSAASGKEIGIVGSAIEGAGNATNSSVTITGGSFTTDDDIFIAGGYLYSNDNATSNHVTISGGTFSADGINIDGGSVDSGNANNNHVTLADGTFSSSGDFYITGGSTGNGAAINNSVTLKSSVSSLTSARIFGGHTNNTGDAFTGNILNLQGFNGTVDSISNFETINFSGSAGLTATTVVLGASSATTQINVVGDSSLNATFSGEGFVKTGAGTLTLAGTGSHNKTIIQEGALSIASDTPLGSGTNTLAGGTLKLTGNSYSSNWSVANGTTTSRIEATQASAFAGDISFVPGAHDTWLTLATPDATTLVTFSGSIQNASGGNLAIAPNSYIKLTDADNRYTGETRVGESAILELDSGAGLDSPVLTLEEGAKFIKNSSATHDLGGDTLNVYNQATYQGNLEASGATVNFRLTADYDPAAATQPILTVTGDANLDNATLTAAVTGASAKVTRGDELNLLEVTGNLSASNLKTAAVNDQGLLNIELGELTIASGSGGNLSGKVTAVGVNEKTKAYAEGFLGGAATLAGAADRAALGLSAAVQSAGGQARLAGFGSLGGGSLRYETGSHVDVEGYNLMGGLASGSRFEAGTLTVGAFVEYGEGDYSTHNTFASGKVKGKGDTEYRGVGALAKFAFANGFYADGALRVGTVDNDFHSVAINGSYTAYDVSSRYYGAHVGVGKLWRLGEKNSLDVSGQYLWTHSKGDKARLKGATAMTLDFDDVDSSRLRIGARYSHALDENTQGYIGAAWEKEFDGKAKATLNGYRIESPELKGDSGRLELGFVTAPLSRYTPLTLEVGVQGYWGQREGVTGSARLNYAF
jgi:outer membrane autotransporter protein